MAKPTAAEVLAWLERVQRESGDLGDRLDPKRTRTGDLAKRVDHVGAVAYAEASTVRAMVEEER